MVRVFTLRVPAYKMHFIPGRRENLLAFPYLSVHPDDPEALNRQGDTRLKVGSIGLLVLERGVKSTTRSRVRVPMSVSSLSAPSFRALASSSRRAFSAHHALPSTVTRRATLPVSSRVCLRRAYSQNPNPTHQTSSGSRDKSAVGVRLYVLAPRALN